MQELQVLDHLKLHLMQPQLYLPEPLLEEEVVERDALKKQSGAILDKLNKKARKGGRKKKAAD